MASNFKYSDWRKSENIKKYEVSNVEKYFFGLENIEHTFSGRMDIPLVVNSISLFENGYFDAAYWIGYNKLDRKDKDMLK